jgi:shikimate kinase
VTDRLFLVGMMAVGKTTVGRLCAERLGWPFLDSDAQLLSDTGRTAKEIFDADGDEELRILECRALTEAIAQERPVVVAVAGGVVLIEASRAQLMSSGVVVWLRATVETLNERVEHGEARPHLGADPRQTLSDLYRDRQSLYASVAQFVIDVDDLAPDDVVARIFEETGLAKVVP